MAKPSVYSQSETALLSKLKSVIDKGKFGSGFMQVKEIIQPCPKRQILDSSQLKDFAEDNFRF